MSRARSRGRALAALLAVLCAAPALLGAGPSAAALAPQAASPQVPVASPGQAEPNGRRIQSIEVRGAVRSDAQEVLEAFGVTIGDVYADRDIERGLEVLFRRLRLLARVEYRPSPESVEEIQLLITVDKELERDLEPRFTGNHTVKDEDLYEWAGLVEEGALYLYQARRVRERLLRAYREDGYYFVEIRVVQRDSTLEARDPETLLASDVIFEIVEGPQVRVRGVEYHGNEALHDGQFLFFKRGLPRLASVEMRAPVLWGLFAKKLNMDTLAADIVALRQVYRDYGYLDAVVEFERFDFNAERDWVTIHIAIDEGELYRVRSVSVEAISRSLDPSTGRLREELTDLLFPEEELLELLTTEPGSIFDKRSRLADQQALRRRFGEEGYIDHPSLPDTDRLEVLEPEIVFDAEEPLIDVVYRVAKGRQQFLREVQVSGNLHTQDRVVRRLITVDPGEAADPLEIDRSRQRLQGTGWFSDPRNLIDHREPYYRFKETGDPFWKDLEYVVQEGQDLLFNISGGVSSNLGAFGVVEFTKQNFDITNLPDTPWSLIRDVARRRAFHGAGQELRLRASPGTEVSFFDIYFLEPDVFGRHRERISLSLSARRRLRIFDTHDEARQEFGFEVGRQLGPDSAVFAGYTFGTIEVDDIDGGGEPVLNDPLAVPLTLKNQEGESDLAFLRFGYRFRNTDNRISPRNGTSLRWVNRLYDEAIGSDYDFFKSELNFDFYDEFDSVGEEVPDRYHLALQAGIATPYGETDDIPYSERFFLGGQRRLRGFDFRGVGPNQKGFPLGGETFVYGSIEYRRPLVTQTQPGTYLEVETMHAGVFLDAGIIGTDDFELELDDARVSAGILFGISVPLPITFSFGFPLEEGQGDDTQVLGFNIGF